jgi:hypothetical protein
MIVDTAQTLSGRSEHSGAREATDCVATSQHKQNYIAQVGGHSSERMSSSTRFSLRINCILTIQPDSHEPFHSSRRASVWNVLQTWHGNSKRKAQLRIIGEISALPLNCTAEPLTRQWRHVIFRQKGPAGRCTCSIGPRLI